MFATSAEGVVVENLSRPTVKEAARGPSTPTRAPLGAARVSAQDDNFTLMLRPCLIQSCPDILLTYVYAG
ncbi:MAG: hypothetical protein WA423_17950 [Candidatus Sulfotelmatobacter sp.]